MRELSLAVLITITQMEAVGLVALEVADRGNLKPAALCGAPKLKIIGNGGSEGHISAAKAQNPVLQTKHIDYFLNVGNHIVESLVAVLRLFDAHYFYFVELVQTVEPAHILAV